VQQMRGEWPSRLEGIDCQNMVFLDETALTTDMTRRYGRAEGGKRAHDSAPSRWNTTTLLGAVGAGGWVAAMTVDSATDVAVFLTFVERILCPALKPGQVVIMDNLPAHKVEGVRELIEAAGATVCYLPPYSPDFNPIEKCWSQLKAYLRAAKARTAAALEHALSEALQHLTPEQVRAYCRSCGYRT